MIKMLLLAVISSVAIMSTAFAEGVIVCASTTSTQNSGCLKYILPVFEKKTGTKVKVVAVGTGAALENGKRGTGCVLCHPERTN